MYHHLTTRPGNPHPLGATRKGSWTNFALFSSQAQSVTLALFTQNEPTPFLEISLDAQSHKTEDIWHISIQNIPQMTCYGYKIQIANSPSKEGSSTSEHYLLDPYAKGVRSPHLWQESRTNPYSPLGKILDHHEFDWKNIQSPNIAQENLIIYEAHVRAMTQDPESGALHKGTFLGLIEKIPYLKELGINAIELLPIFEFNECENKQVNPFTQEPLVNFWGYSTVNFFTPMNRYSTGDLWHSSMMECKEMVRQMHANGIEVFLDVVYNHTAECAETGPLYSFKGIDKPVYYLLGKEGQYLNFSGTGNTLNCNHPVVAKLIIDSLIYWTKEFHIDGFRFDLAAILTRDTNGDPMASPPLIHQILAEPSLKHVKLIAEAWDASGLYQVGSFPAGGRWYEWNGKYRDVLRRFIKGTDGYVAAFATALCGSEDLYGKDRSPYHSINFITAHDGYTLTDLVSFQGKYNESNGENNLDGENHNESWNCGHEGPTQDKSIVQLRQRQKKNFLIALFLSAGTPMLLMGDEYGHTRGGNNNPYCQDNETNWFLWKELKRNKKFFIFCKNLIHFRKTHAHLFCRKHFLTSDDISWHGHTPFCPVWDSSSRFIAFTLNQKKEPYLYVAFNAHYEKANIELPLPRKGKRWHILADTAKESLSHFDAKRLVKKAAMQKITMQPYSCLVLECK